MVKVVLLREAAIRYPQGTVLEVTEQEAAMLIALARAKPVQEKSAPEKPKKAAAKKKG